jgi:hypothetical protein
MPLSAFGVEDSRISKDYDDGQSQSHKGAWLGAGLGAAGLAGGALLARDKIPGLRALGGAKKAVAGAAAATPSLKPVARPGSWNFDALPKKPGPKVLKPMPPPTANPAPGQWNFNHLQPPAA